MDVHLLRKLSHGASALELGCGGLYTEIITDLVDMDGTPDVLGQVFYHLTVAGYSIVAARGMVGYGAQCCLYPHERTGKG